MDDTTHEGNATPTATDDDVKRMDADTEQNANPGGAVEGHGVGGFPADSTDPEQNQDPKSAGTPVHPAPTADSQEQAGNAEGGDTQGEAG